MNKLTPIALISLSLSLSSAFANDNLDLEPSINGAVSAFGLYPSQAEEDAAYALTFEPCIEDDNAVDRSYTAQIWENAERARRLRQSVEEKRGVVVQRN